MSIIFTMAYAIRHLFTSVFKALAKAFLLTWSPKEDISLPLTLLEVK